jgi:hypothetical protein
VIVDIRPNALISVFASAEVRRADTECPSSGTGYLQWDSGETAYTGTAFLFRSDGKDSTFERFFTPKTDYGEGIRKNMIGNMGWVGPFPATPGTRTYKLVHSKDGDNSCEVLFRNRHLWVLVTKPA